MCESRPSKETVKRLAEQAKRDQAVFDMLAPERAWTSLKHPMVLVMLAIIGVLETVNYMRDTPEMVKNKLAAERRARNELPNTTE